MKACRRVDESAYVSNVRLARKKKQQFDSDGMAGGNYVSRVNAPIREATGHQTRMDKVESLLVYPLVFCIIDNELEIWWHPITKGQFATSATTAD
jgi:hypothetical protein